MHCNDNPCINDIDISCFVQAYWLHTVRTYDVMRSNTGLGKVHVILLLPWHRRLVGGTKRHVIAISSCDVEVHTHATHSLTHMYIYPVPLRNIL